MDNQFLLDDLCLAGPFGFYSEVGRGINASYYLSWQNVQHDPEVGVADRKFEMGNRRRAYVNNAFRKISKDFTYQSVVRVKDLCVGEQNKSNNHLEIFFGRYLATHHHLSGSRTLPDSSKYLEQNVLLNSEIAQQELFGIKEFAPPSSTHRPYSVLFLHRENPENRSEVLSIEVVLPFNQKRLVAFDISDLVSRQSYFDTLKPELLLDFKIRHEEKRKQRRA